MDGEYDAAYTEMMCEAFERELGNQKPVLVAFACRVVGVSIPPHMRK